MVRDTLEGLNRGEKGAAISTAAEVYGVGFEPSSEVRASIISRAISHHAASPETVEVAFRNAQLFLRCLAANSGLRLSPSKDVDALWHAWLDHPGDFEEQCQASGGPIYHFPHGPEGPPPDALNPTQTLHFLQASGYEPDPEVWPENGEADCGGQKCYGSDCSGGKQSVVATGIATLPTLRDGLRL